MDPKTTPSRTRTRSVKTDHSADLFITPPTSGPGRKRRRYMKPKAKETTKPDPDAIGKEEATSSSPDEVETKKSTMINLNLARKARSDTPEISQGKEVVVEIESRPQTTSEETKNDQVKDDGDDQGEIVSDNAGKADTPSPTIGPSDHNIPKDSSYDDQTQDEDIGKTSEEDEKAKKLKEAKDELGAFVKSFKDIKHKLYEERLEGLAVELLAIENETHPELKADLVALDKEYERKIKAIEYRYKFNKDMIYHSQIYGIQNAENEYDAANLEARRSMLDHGYKLSHRLTQVCMGNETKLFRNGGYHHPNTGALRYKFSPYTSIVDQHEIVTLLEDEDINEDLAYINGSTKVPKEAMPPSPVTPLTRSPLSMPLDSAPIATRPTSAPKKPATAMSTPPVQPARSGRNRAPINYQEEEEDHGGIYQANDKSLIYRGQVFRTQNYITVKDNVNGMTYDATITAINHHEVWLKRVDNSRTKLYFHKMRKGNYEILPEGSSSKS